MSLKALTPLIDPVLGQNVELSLCGESMEVREMLLLGPSSLSLTLTSYLLALRGALMTDCIFKHYLQAKATIRNLFYTFHVFRLPYHHLWLTMN
jgi:hypothetical protein